MRKALLPHEQLVEPQRFARVVRVFSR